MVLSVDDWVETNDGEIGLVVSTEDLKRTGGQVTLYTPEDHSPHVVKMDDIKGAFPTLLRSS